jgi:hypothetical protein
MTTSEEVRKRALALATAGTATEDAVREILECCGEKRVSVVMARRQVRGRGEGPDPMSERAGELLDEVLRRLPQ